MQFFAPQFHKCASFWSLCHVQLLWRTVKTAALIATEYVGLNCIKIKTYIAWACIPDRNTYALTLSKNFACTESINFAGWVWIIRVVYFQINSINWLKIFFCHWVKCQRKHCKRKERLWSRKTYLLNKLLISLIMECSSLIRFVVNVYIVWLLLCTQSLFAYTVIPIPL